jgi:hypothetical protein
MNVCQQCQQQCQRHQQKKRKILGLFFFFIFCKELSCGIPKDWIFAYFSFLGVDKLILAWLSKSPVSLTPAINFRLFGYFWLVSTTPGKNVIAGVDDTGDKLYPSVNDTSNKLFASVNDTADKFFHRR